MKRFSLIFLIIAVCGFSVFPQVNSIKDLKPTVILISLDGFRYDYLEKYPSANLNYLAKKGVRAEWMIPSFPTKTFPNHYTIATGLYPNNHGIVENNVYDFGTVFTMSKREEVENPRWWFGEPVWVTAEKQGQIAASFFFVGTETKIQGYQPTFWKKYEHEFPNEKRVETVLSWLDLPREKRPTLITMYFSDTDDAGHKFSPDSEEVKKAVAEVDNRIGQLLNGLKERKIEKKVNIIIVSDHGMATVNLKNVEMLDDYIDLDLTERILYTHEIIQIFPKNGKEDEIIEKLKKMKHASCWRKSEIPARLKWGSSPRISPLVCSTEEGWIVTTKSRYESLKKREDIEKPKGGHGYDNRYQSMQSIFIASGKAFKKGKTVKPFENVNVYNLICKVLGLNPAKNDGNRDLAKEMLR